ncbi:MAG TPA: hypothetical protein PK747_07520 [Acidobacteriota bacterium]|jgi:hypothetical protein|nr:hypothetical protein [Acidobacteriota bacterium]HNT17655.1 hypothetical protein [Acidobacteriota bacterium]HPA27076.1 hypothetical protein [Acidobacteriota bacterium]HQO20426.1 hypothetical protein [Acidobacteriota bacterium]HQQ47238.1 hypothetical protein [Acidobacteriota bacterium]
MPNEPLEVTLKVTRVLEIMDIPYFITGSLASTLYGMVRSTQDADIVAEMNADHVKPFAESLSKEFYLDEEMMCESIRYNKSFNLIHKECVFKVDVFVPVPSDYLRSQFSRAKLHTFTFQIGAGAIFASPEDTILSKLRWFRAGGEGSDRQWRDILGVLKAGSGEIDVKYLRNWAGELKVTDLLERALKEAS